ncbi:GLYCINE-RICH PROTEIN FAMILY [Salix viminalis]|uniref:GLYCINE-RICH PROTEIN FAMILY n=1 Tax=Salix viminalis TaxID=40686 RepID=A0A9Q0UFK6_SALVM|nr:GLYCINE-RICH PROTEIN FAMILY [Salix viminalis]
MGHPNGDTTCIFPLLQFKAAGIDGNVDSKPEVPSLPPSIMSSEKQITPSSSASQAKTVIKELCLESVYKKDVAREFYCANCNSCIQKVMIHGNEEGSRFRWSSCFSFLIEICTWFFSDSLLIDEDTGPEAVTSPDTVMLLDSTERTTGSELRGAKILEIVKSIIYGGLIGSINSLTVVTSAARSGAATSSIIALSLAKLITGILTFAHNLLDLKSKQRRDLYQELVGRREKSLLHATIALLSFLVFGLVPPAVYGFTFMETDDKNLKLVAVAAGCFLCISILAIGKACIKKPTKKNFRIVLCYFVTGIKAAVVSYVVGDLAKKFIEKLGWFEPGKAFPLPLAEMSSGRLAWASY